MFRKYICAFSSAWKQLKKNTMKMQMVVLLSRCQSVSQSVSIFSDCSEFKLPHLLALDRCYVWFDYYMQNHSDAANACAYYNGQHGIINGRLAEPRDYNEFRALQKMFFKVGQQFIFYCYSLFYGHILPFMLYRYRLNLS